MRKGKCNRDRSARPRVAVLSIPYTQIDGKGLEGICGIHLTPITCLREWLEAGLESHPFRHRWDSRRQAFGASAGHGTSHNRGDTTYLYLGKRGERRGM